MQKVAKIPLTAGKTEATLWPPLSCFSDQLQSVLSDRNFLRGAGFYFFRSMAIPMNVGRVLIFLGIIAAYVI